MDKDTKAAKAGQPLVQLGGLWVESKSCPCVHTQISWRWIIALKVDSKSPKLVEENVGDVPNLVLGRASGKEKSGKVHLKSVPNRGCPGRVEGQPRTGRGACGI